jgi:hypothetical protein
VKERVNYVTSGHKIYLRYVYFGFFSFNWNQNSKTVYIQLYRITLHFHRFSATIDTFIIPWDELLHSLLISARVLCCQPSWHSCFHLATVQILLQRCKQTIISGRRNYWLISIRTLSLVTGFYSLCTSGVINFPKNVRDTSEFLASDGWHEGKFALEIQVCYVPT